MQHPVLDAEINTSFKLPRDAFGVNASSLSLPPFKCKASRWALIIPGGVAAVAAAERGARNRADVRDNSLVARRHPHKDTRLSRRSKELGRFCSEQVCSEPGRNFSGTERIRYYVEWTLPKGSNTPRVRGLPAESTERRESPAFCVLRHCFHHFSDDKPFDAQRTIFKLRRADNSEKLNGC